MAHADGFGGEEVAAILAHDQIPKTRKPIAATTATQTAKNETANYANLRQFILG
jgi:hypothetical protein